MFEFDERELAILGQAARVVDTIAALDAAVAVDGLTVRGSRLQPVLHPAVAEVRQCRLALARLLGELALPDTRSRPATAGTRRARKAAEFRWDLAKERGRGPAAC